MTPLEALFTLNQNAPETSLKDGLIEHISKAKALANIATSEDFLENLDIDIRNYLWTLSDVLNQAYEMLALLIIKAEKLE